MNRLFKLGGFLASVVLIAFGIVAIVLGGSGHNEVATDLKNERIVGTPDMTPKAIQAEAGKAGLKHVTLPSCDVANKPIDSGGRAKCFASYMRVHALEATGGLTYSEMPRYATADGKGTNDPAKAKKDPTTGQPADNQARSVWVTETALSTALNTSYFAQQVSLFSIIMGIALVLTGIGFFVLTLGVLIPPAGRRERAQSVGAGSRAERA